MKRRGDGGNRQTIVITLLVAAACIAVLALVLVFVAFLDPVG